MREGCAVVLFILLIGFLAYFPASGVHAVLVFQKNPTWLVWVGTIVAFLAACLMFFASFLCFRKLVDGDY